MSAKQKYLKRIEELNANQLAEALEFNGYAECVEAIRTNSIDGEHFLTLTEVQILFCRIPTIQARRLWSFIQQVRQDPTQFLLTSQIDKNTLSKVNNKFDKPPLNKTTPTNTMLKANRPVDKPNLPYKPKMENNAMKVYEDNSSSLTTQENKLFKNKLEHTLTRKNVEEKSNNSFIHTWKQPSIPPRPNHLKPININLDINKQIEESSDENSDGYLSPRIFNPTEEKDVGTVSTSSTSTSRNNSVKHSSSFLSKYKKNFSHLEIRPQVIENKYEEQSSKPATVNPRSRPLPPVPVNTSNESQFEDAAIFNSADEQLAEYAPILGDEEDISNFREASTINNNNQKFYMKQNSYKSVTISKDNIEDLPDYFPLPDDAEENNSIKRNMDSFESVAARHQLGKNGFAHEPPLQSHNRSFRTQEVINAEQQIKLDGSNRDELQPEYTSILEEGDLPTKPVSLFHRPLPPTPLSPINFTTHTQTASAVDKPERRTPDKLLKPPLNLSGLPKPPYDLPNITPESLSNLPKPPSNLPKPPNFLLTPDDSSTLSNRYQRPLPPLPPSEPEEEISDTNPSDVGEEHTPYYSQVDLTTESCYRETDRTGARILLHGLEDGAFLIRPSRKDKYICTFSIKKGKKMFNVGIEKDARGVLQFGSVEPNFQQPVFYGVCDIISYYSARPLHIDGESVVLKNVLPHSRR